MTDSDPATDPSTNRSTATRREMMNLLGAGVLTAGLGRLASAFSGDRRDKPSAIPERAPQLDAPATMPSYSRNTVSVVLGANSLPWTHGRFVVRVAVVDGQTHHVTGPVVSRDDPPLKTDIPLSYPTPPTRELASYEVFLAPIDDDGVHYDRARFVCASDPFVLTADGLDPRPYSTRQSSHEEAGFRRTDLTGRYRLSFEWWEHNRRWTLTSSVEKRAYHRAATAERGITRCYRDALENPTVETVGQQLCRKVTATTDVGEWGLFQTVRAFVYALDYRSDNRGSGTPEYPKYVEETLVENGGDCEDLAMVLAGLLNQPPFDYDTALVFPVGHVAVGVACEDLPRVAEDEWTTVTAGDTEYVLLETTARQPVGRLAEEFRGRDVAAVYDGQWRRVDLSTLPAFARRLTSKGGNLGSVSRFF